MLCFGEGVKLYRIMIKKKLELLLKNEETRLIQMQTRLKQLPQGKLYERIVHNRKYYSVYLKGKELGITNNKELIEQLKEKLILIENINSASKACASISAMVHDLPNYSYDDPISTQWAEKDIKSNPYKTDHLKFRTQKGHLVRSKSERFIADTLFSLKIPYQYESPLILGDRTTYPDFLILKPNNDLILWEHFGLLDNHEYQQSCLRKIKLYYQHGFSQHKNLICTTEGDLKDRKEIEDIIQRFYFS